MGDPSDRAIREWQQQVATELDALAEEIRSGSISDYETLCDEIDQRVLTHMPEDFEEDDEEYDDEYGVSEEDDEDGEDLL